MERAGYAVPDLAADNAQLLAAARYGYRRRLDAEWTACHTTKSRAVVAGPAHIGLYRRAGQLPTQRIGHGMDSGYTHCAGAFLQHRDRQQRGNTMARNARSIIYGAGIERPNAHFFKQHILE